MCKQHVDVLTSKVPGKPSRPRILVPHAGLARPPIAASSLLASGCVFWSLSCCVFCLYQLLRVLVESSRARTLSPCLPPHPGCRPRTYTSPRSVVSVTWRAPFSSFEGIGSAAPRGTRSYCFFWTEYQITPPLLPPPNHYPPLPSRLKTQPQSTPAPYNTTPKPPLPPGSLLPRQLPLIIPPPLPRHTPLPYVLARLRAGAPGRAVGGARALSLSTTSP